MDTNIFSENKLTYLMNKLIRENKKKIYIAGDFNFDLLKFASHQDTAIFFNKMTSNFLTPLIIIPTKINSTNDTLIDNKIKNIFQKIIIFTQEICRTLIGRTFSLTCSQSIGMITSMKIMLTHRLRTFFLK